MNKPIDPETLKIPAFRRKKAIVTKARQKLIMTALDRKEAGLAPNSKTALAPRRSISQTPRKLARSSAVTKTPAETTGANFPLKPKKVKQIGYVTNYLEKIDVAIILLSKGIKNGDILLIEGPDYIFTQPAEEMQIERKAVKRPKKGSHIGLKVAFEAEVDGKVYKIA